MVKKEHQSIIFMEQMSMLHTRARTSIPINILNAAIVTIFCWPAIDHRLLLAWFLILTLLSVGRYLSCKLFQKNQAITSTEMWAKSFLAGSFLSGLLWGGFIFLFPQQSTISPLMLITLIFLAGMTADATSYGSAYYKSIVSFNIPALVPSSLYFALLGGYTNYSISLVLMLYTLMLLRSGLTAEKMITRFMEQRLINAEQSDKLDTQRAFLQNVLDTIDVGVVVFDHDMHLSLWNKALTEHLDIPGTWLGERPSIESFIRHNATKGDFGEGDVEEILQTRLKRYEDPFNIKPHRHERTRKNGIRLEVMGNPMPDGGMVTTYTDVTERFHRLEKIRMLADHDGLTGLVNRPVFERRLRRAIANAKRNQKMVSIYYLDLDHFKDVNDTLGHPTGDQLLKQVATRLSETARETDTVARLGGDEFAIIGTNHSSLQDVNRLAERMLEVLNKPFEIEGNLVHTGASVGATVYPLDDSNPIELFSHADMALYKAKEGGRDQFALFDNKMDDELRDRKKIEIELRNAIDSDELLLFYQPQIDILSKKIIGAEALLRWDHPTRGIIAPDAFLAIAEATRLINPIGNWVIRESCEFASRLSLEGFKDFKTSINLSAVQFRSDDLLSYIIRTMKKYDITGDQLELEITESMVITDVEDAIKTLRRFQKLGISVAIDDFGTGYSSMAYLKDFSANVLKIDRSFVNESIVRSDNAKIISGIISLGHSLGMKIVAEGVETKEQEKLLKDLKCDIGQGYFYGRPMPEKNFNIYMKETLVS